MVAEGGPVEGLVGGGVVVIVVVRVAGSSSLGLGWWIGGCFVATHKGDAFADEFVDVYAGRAVSDDHLAGLFVHDGG